MNADLRRIPTSHRFSFPLELRRDPLRAVLRLAGAGGDGAIVEFKKHEVVLLNHPGLVGELLTRDGTVITKARGIKTASYILGNGLLTSDEPHHGRARRLALPAFHRRRLQGYAGVMVRRTTEAAAAWRDGDEVDVYADMTRLTMEIAAETLFGSSIGPDVPRISAALGYSMGLFWKHTTHPLSSLLLRLPVPSTLRVRRARRTLDALVYGLIAERRASGEDTGDLLSMLLAAQDEETGLGLSDEEVRDEVITLLAAGHDTTANALTWTLWLLSEHPETQAALHAEVDAALGGRPAGFDDLARLPFTRQVFSEAMRLYPPSWMIVRKAACEVEIGGHRFPQRTTFLVSQYALHRNPRWWDAPDAFRPEHFSAEAKQARPKFAYLPFGAGQRGCIGESFAWTEGVLALATLAQRWRMHSAGAQPGLNPTVTLSPDGPVPLHVERRSGAASSAAPASARARLPAL